MSAKRPVRIDPYKGTADITRLDHVIVGISQCRDCEVLIREIQPYRPYFQKHYREPGWMWRCSDCAAERWVRMRH